MKGGVNGSELEKLNPQVGPHNAKSTRMWRARWHVAAGGDVKPVRGVHVEENIACCTVEMRHCWSTSVKKYFKPGVRRHRCAVRTAPLGTGPPKPTS